MRIVVASMSALKLDAATRAFSHLSDVTITGTKAASGVAEQPMDAETVTGAFNRLKHAQEQMPGANLYLSIENGIFTENGKYIDKAVVVALQPGQPAITTYSDGVEYPAHAVEETRKRGFDKHTVGKIMLEMGLVQQHDDPHLSLTGISRVSYIDAALANARSQLKL